MDDDSDVFDYRSRVTMDGEDDMIRERRGNSPEDPDSDKVMRLKENISNLISTIRVGAPVQLKKNINTLISSMREKITNQKKQILDETDKRCNSPDVRPGPSYVNKDRSPIPYRQHGSFRKSSLDRDRSNFPFMHEQRIGSPSQERKGFTYMGEDRRPDSPYNRNMGEDRRPDSPYNRRGSPYLSRDRSRSPYMGRNRKSRSPYVSGKSSPYLHRDRSRSPYMDRNRSNSPYMGGKRASSPFLNEQRSHSPFIGGKRSNSPYMGGKRSSSPSFSGNRNCSPNLGRNRSSSPYMTERRAGSPYMGENRRGSPYMGENRRDSPYMGENRRGSPYMGENRRDSPYMGENRRGSPYMGENRRDSPYMGENRRDSPYMGENRRAGSPYMGENRRDSPYMGENRRGSPYIGENRRDSPYMGENRRDSPYMGENRRAGSPYMGENRRGSPYINKNRADSPYLRDERSHSPYLRDEKSNSPFVRYNRRESVNDYISDDEFTNLRKKLRPSRSPRSGRRVVSYNSDTKNIRIHSKGLLSHSPPGASKESRFDVERSTSPEFSSRWPGYSRSCSNEDKRASRSPIPNTMRDARPVNDIILMTETISDDSDVEINEGPQLKPITKRKESEPRGRWATSPDGRPQRGNRRVGSPGSDATHSWSSRHTSPPSYRRKSHWSLNPKVKNIDDDGPKRNTEQRSRVDVSPSRDTPPRYSPPRSSPPPTGARQTSSSERRLKQVDPIDLFKKIMSQLRKECEEEEDSKVRKALLALWTCHQRECSVYLTKPNSYPDYKKEYKGFVLQQTKSLVDDCANPNDYNFHEGWKHFWPTRMILLFREAWNEQKMNCISALLEQGGVFVADSASRHSPDHSDNKKRKLSKSEEKDHQIVDILKMLGHMKDKFEELEKPFTKIFSMAVALKNDNKDSNMVVNDDTLPVLEKLQNKIQNILKKDNLSIIQKTIIQEYYVQYSSMLDMAKKLMTKNQIKISSVAEQTMAFTAQATMDYIKDALVNQGHIDVTHADIMKLYIAVKEVQFGMGKSDGSNVCDGPSTSSSVSVNPGKSVSDSSLSGGPMITNTSVAGLFSQPPPSIPPPNVPPPSITAYNAIPNAPPYSGPPNDSPYSRPPPYPTLPNASPYPTPPNVPSYSKPPNFSPFSVPPPAQNPTPSILSGVPSIPPFSRPPTAAPLPVPSPSQDLTFPTRFPQPVPKPIPPPACSGPPSVPPFPRPPSVAPLPVPPPSQNTAFPKIYPQPVPKPVPTPVPPPAPYKKPYTNLVSLPCAKSKSASSVVSKAQGKSAIETAKGKVDQAMDVQKTAKPEKQANTSSTSLNKTEKDATQAVQKDGSKEQNIFTAFDILQNIYKDDTFQLSQISPNKSSSTEKKVSTPLQKDDGVKVSQAKSNTEPKKPLQTTKTSTAKRTPTKTKKCKKSEESDVMPSREKDAQEPKSSLSLKKKVSATKPPEVKEKSAVLNVKTPSKIKKKNPLSDKKNPLSDNQLGGKETGQAVKAVRRTTQWQPKPPNIQQTSIQEQVGDILPQENANNLSGANKVLENVPSTSKTSRNTRMRKSKAKKVEIEEAVQEDIKKEVKKKVKVPPSQLSPEMYQFTLRDCLQCPSPPRLNTNTEMTSFDLEKYSLPLSVFDSAPELYASLPEESEQPVPEKTEPSPKKPIKIVIPSSFKKKNHAMTPVQDDNDFQ